MRIVIFLAILLGISSFAYAESFPLPNMYIESFNDPVGFEQYINQNRQSLASPRVKNCLEKIGALNPKISDYIEACLFKGDPEEALICLNGDPGAATQVWANSFYDSVFRNVPWTRTAMGRTAQYSQFSSRNMSPRQNSYLLQKESALLPICD